jgi:hypothetical protein
MNDDQTMVQLSLHIYNYWAEYNKQGFEIRAALAAIKPRILMLTQYIM